MANGSFAHRAAAPSYMKRDHHAELGELLLRAETAPDELERLLSVSRIVMRLILDVMRPGASYGDTPMVILGQHSMSHRILADKYRGDELWLFLQEIVSHDSVDRPILLENKRRGPEIARFSMRITPVASVQPRIRSQRSALAWPAGSSGPPELHVALTGDGRVRLTQHSDAYSFTLPMLRFSEALTNSASIELTGSCSVRCGATGLMLTMKFKEGRVVKGTIVRIQGNEDIPIAKLVGNWDEDIIVESIAMDAAGTLMSASEFQPPLQTTINLAQPGPRQMMRLWSGILESMNFVDASQATSHGGKGDSLAQSLPRHLKKSLQFEVAKGLRPNNTHSEAESAAIANIHLPPCIKRERIKGHALSYQLYYSLQAVAS